jgi:dGTPase
MQACMDWQPLFTTRRLAEPEPRAAPNRNAFQIDQDRIVFSRPFRRLQQKTQVHPLPFNAHVRNRLVHTLEVASVGRSLGYAAGVRISEELAQAGRTPDDLGYLVQATCLAHDIGNPPFGHAGEEVIAEWMGEWLGSAEARALPLDADLAHFDGNAQGFRILTRADGYRQRGGLRLTCATLAAFLKYPWEAGDLRAARDGRAGVKFNLFATERAAFAEVIAGCALAGRHPAVWLMEAADDLTYTLADLEDAVEMNIIPLAEYEALVQPLAQVEGERLAREENASQRIALLRARAIGRLLDACAEAFVAERATLGDAPVRGGLFARLTPEVRQPFDAIRATNVERVYFHARKVEHEIGARDTLAKALSVFVPACAAFARGAVSLREKQALSLMDDYAPAPWMRPAEVIRCAVDFVAGMTDHYAAYLAQRLRGL